MRAPLRDGREGECHIGHGVAHEPHLAANALALEIRDADEEANRAVSALPGMTGVTEDTGAGCLREERDVVRLLGATCNTPVGVHATAVSERSITVQAFVGLPDGSHWIRDALEMPHPRGVGLIGHHVAERLHAAGADELLAEAERLVAAG